MDYVIKATHYRIDHLNRLANEGGPKVLPAGGSMAWCNQCRREMNASPGHFCPRCGQRLARSTTTSVQADALARMTTPEDQDQDPGEVQQVIAEPVHTPPAPQHHPQPTVIYYQQVVTPPPPRVQVIEKTSKYWKAQMLWAVLLILAAMGGCAFSGAMPDKHTAQIVSTICVVVFLVGVFWYVVARVGAWWDHG